MRSAALKSPVYGLYIIRENHMEFISVIELTGTAAFAVSGALAAIDKELDYYNQRAFWE